MKNRLLLTTCLMISSLLAFADPGRILFGSDWPYAPADRVKAMTTLYDRYPLDDDVRAAIDRDNARSLLGRRMADTG